MPSPDHQDPDRQVHGRDDPARGHSAGGTSPDADRIRLAGEGDRGAQEALLAEHLPALRGFVRLRLGASLRNREESVDLVQSICGDLFKDLPAFDYRGPRSFRRWLLQRAENKIRSRGRFWSREKRSGDGEVQGADLEDLRAAAHTLTPSRMASSREELERFEQAFASLAEDDRLVILLSRVAGLDHAQVSAEMGRSPVATRSLLSRALARLATRLEPD